MPDTGAGAVLIGRRVSARSFLRFAPIVIMAVFVCEEESTRFRCDYKVFVNTIAIADRIVRILTPGLYNCLTVLAKLYAVSA